MWQRNKYSSEMLRNDLSEDSRGRTFQNEDEVGNCHKKTRFKMTRRHQSDVSLSANSGTREQGTCVEKATGSNFWKVPFNPAAWAGGTPLLVMVKVRAEGNEQLDTNRKFGEFLPKKINDLPPPTGDFETVFSEGCFHKAITAPKCQARRGRGLQHIGGVVLVTPIPP